MTYLLDLQAGFTGHIKDAATGLNYMQARYYDPVIGRFLSVDPVTFMDTGNPGMFNRYAYTYNDPINLIDPTGMYANCAEFQEGGGGNCTEQTETYTDKEGEEQTRITGLNLDELPSHSMANEHYKSNDKIDLTVPISSIMDGSEVDFDKLQSQGSQPKKFLGAEVATTRRSQILGTVTVLPNADGTARLNTDTYYFEQHSYSGGLGAKTKTFARNMATKAFDPGPGSPYNIKFTGSLSRPLPTQPSDTPKLLSIR